MSRRVCAAFAVLVVVAAGCSDDGPKRYRVSGAVTFDGRPIPYGEVLFTPDAAKRNAGPQGIAPIKDGKFDTTATGGMGAGGGPTVVRVNGMTGPGGKTLCEYEYPADLPKADAPLDIAVPKKGGAKPGGKADEI